MDENIRELTADGKKARFSVIGAGNLGTALIYSLANRGYRLSGIYKKSKFHLYDSRVTDDITAMLQQSDVVIIAAQESKIAEAAQIAARSGAVKGKICFHTSNGLTSDTLLPLKEAGAYIASFSPLQTFPPFKPDRPEEVFKGIYFLWEGDAEAGAMAGKMAVDLEAHVLKVDKDRKVFFHIAGVAASNFLISILKLAERQLKKTASGEAPDIKVLLPLIRQTLENVENRGVEASLTGPFKRKQTAIIQKHLAVLEKDEAAIYKALTEFLALK